jgi:hypothetical protein
VKNNCCCYQDDNYYYGGGGAALLPGDAFGLFLLFLRRHASPLVNHLSPCVLVRLGLVPTLPYNSINNITHWAQGLSY